MPKRSALADPSKLLVMVALGCLAPASNSYSQEFPARPVTLVVPFAPGGGTDSIARDIAREPADKLGKPVLVDNREGDGGAIAAAAIAKAPPDGHSLLFVSSTFVTHAAADPGAKYDVRRAIVKTSGIKL